MADLDLTRLVRTARMNLRRRMARRPVAFVMSGGGSQGSFEAGVLRFLYDDVGLRPSIVVGSSVGAIIAAKLAEGDDEETGRRAIDEVEAIWRNLHTNDDMWLIEPWLDTLRSQVTWASELRGRAGSREQSPESSQARLILRMLGEVVRNPPQTDGTIDALRAALRARSLVSMDPIRELVERELRPERIATSGLTLRVGAVSLETGELRYVDGDGQLFSRDGVPLDRPKVRLQDAVLASASIPVMYPPTELGGEYYVDGGVREILPLALAFNQLGAGHIFAVVASRPGVDPWHDGGDRGIFEIARRVSADIAPDETLRKEIDPPRGWGRRVTVIVPEVNVHDALTIDPELIARVDRLRVHARGRRDPRARRRRIGAQRRDRPDADAVAGGEGSGAGPAAGGAARHGAAARRHRGRAQDPVRAGGAAARVGRARCHRARAAPRTSDSRRGSSAPGRAPVSSPCSNVTSPATTVAT